MSACSGKPTSGVVATPNGYVDACCDAHASKFLGGEIVTREYVDRLAPMLAEAVEDDPGEEGEEAIAWGEAAEARALAAEAPRRTVLVIDDEAPLLRAMARVLKGLGWRVVTAINPVEARILYAEADVVLSDWDMPQGGGLRTHQESPRPVVFHTGNPDAPREWGVASPVLVKPAEAETIDAALRAAMKGGR